MLRSMTAYGHSQLHNEEGEFSCEIRSVNHRYLDIGVRMDENLSVAESIIRDRVTSRLGRGKVEVTLKFSPVLPESSRLKIDVALLDELLAVISKATDRLSSNAPLDVVRLMQWPGVLTSEKYISKRSAQYALVVFDQALEDLIATRTREGEQLRAMLEERGFQLRDIVKILRDRRPFVVARQKDRLMAQLSQLDVDHDQARLEQELVYAAQRLDIDEELDRLEVHITELFNALTRDEAVGRRLDFLMQEFNREANTVASKSNDSETTKQSVNIKVLIEQMREQVQNIE